MYTHSTNMVDRLPPKPPISLLHRVSSYQFYNPDKCFFLTLVLALSCFKKISADVIHKQKFIKGTFN